MVRVNYGSEVSPDTCAKLVSLFKGETSILPTGIPGEVISELTGRPGDLVLEIVSGRTVEEVYRCLPDNRSECINGAAVLLKVAPDVDFLPIDMAPLIRYFDFYRNDPKITWGFCLDSHLEDLVNILILKNLNNKGDE